LNKDLVHHYIEYFNDPGVYVNITSVFDVKEITEGKFYPIEEEFTCKLVFSKDGDDIFEISWPKKEFLLPHPVIMPSTNYLFPFFSGDITITRIDEEFCNEDSHFIFMVQGFGGNTCCPCYTGFRVQFGPEE
jgi:hypothetical protein